MIIPVLYILGFMVAGCICAILIAMWKDIRARRKPYLADYGVIFLAKKEGAQTDG